MKKFFTLICALVGFAGVANASTVDDLVPLKHSYVMVCDDLGSRPGQNVLFGDDHFIDLASAGTTATNKGKTNLSVVDALGPDGTPLYVTQDIVDKYGEYGEHYNWLRLKNNQDVIAMKPTAGSKLIFFLQGNNKTGKDARYPLFAKSLDDVKNKKGLNPAPTADFTEKTVAGFRYEFVVPNDWGENEVLYVGSYNGDMFVSFIIVEAIEATGTPSVKVGPQTYENGLWYREVTCKTVVADGFPTIATYTTDGSTPNEKSMIYVSPIKCYANQTVRFQAYYDFDGDGKPNADYICEGADNEANVNFVFDAPTITADGANVTITSPYENVNNFYTLNDEPTPYEGSSFTLTESATVTAASQIVNGSYASFISKSSSKDVYVLNAIKENKKIAVTGGDIVVDEDATAKSTDGSTVYKVENGTISADKMDFFVKNLTWSVLKDEKAQYQVPAGQEAYIQMSNTNITFLVAANDIVNVKVTCTKNSCKNIDAADAEDGSQVNDRKCYVNVNDVNYCLKDAEGNETNDLKLYPKANVIEFQLKGGKDVTNKDAEGNETTSFEAADTYYTFKKYSGTGNILISSIEITPAGTAGIGIVNAAEKTNGAIYNLAGQKVNADFKGIVIMNGKKMIQK